MKIDYYEKLEISPDCTDEQIKESYRILAKMYHPDNHVNSTEKVKQMASKKFSDIREAYKTLSDENLRLKYDRQRQISQQKHAEDDYEDDFSEYEYDETYEHRQHEYAYADYGQHDQDEHDNQLDDAIRDFRKGMPRIAKVAAIFAGVLGWIMFISLAFGNWGSNYYEEPVNIDFMLEILREENNDLRQRLEQLIAQSMRHEHFYHRYWEQIRDLNAEWDIARYLRQELELNLQQEDWYDYYRQQIDSLTAQLLTAHHRLTLVRDELEYITQTAFDIQWVLRQMLEAMPGPPDDRFNELWHLHSGLLNHLQFLEFNLAVVSDD